MDTYKRVSFGNFPIWRLTSEVARGKTRATFYMESDLLVSKKLENQIDSFPFFAVQ